MSLSPIGEKQMLVALGAHARQTDIFRPNAGSGHLIHTDLPKVKQITRATIFPE
jgi:hypothetical protein